MIAYFSKLLCGFTNDHANSFITTDRQGNKVWFCLDCGHVAPVSLAFTRASGVYERINAKVDADSSLRERLSQFPRPPLPPAA